MIFLGVGVWELRFPGCRSLKEKRAVLRKIKDRFHQKFRVAVSETGHQDARVAAQITMTAPGSDAVLLQSHFQRLARNMETAFGCYVQDYHYESIRYAPAPVGRPFPGGKP